ncbi:MAG: endonuclease domain-containing protein [Bacteroidetes bacterium]|nr:endonuclease domain-containing protein [Bacteroidota bacterium]MBI3481431.1 endonuclease domain-containing protein [Bacteroidota bacterium]
MKANKDNYHLYNTRLQPFANSLRKNMTKAEACLWKYALSASQMKGYKFRRQRPVINFITDFMCKELMLVIEVDGKSHDFPEVILKDERKQAALEAAGFTVLRFSDGEVLNNMRGVISFLEDWIEKRERALAQSEDYPPPNPRQRGT